MATAMKQETKTKEVNELKQLQKKINEKEQDLIRREEGLGANQERLSKLEIELKKRASDLEDQSNAFLKKMNLVGDSDSFHKFYQYIQDAHALYVVQRGNDNNILETIDLVIKAKKNMNDIKP